MSDLVNLAVGVVVEVIRSVFRKSDIRENGLIGTVGDSITRQSGKAERHENGSVDEGCPGMRCAAPRLRNRRQIVIDVVVEVDHPAECVGDRQDVTVAGVVCCREVIAVSIFNLSTAPFAADLSAKHILRAVGGLHESE